jgi:methylenetetrahydrofolate dehydrogenase (NADP+)/methenyltetrahydrofolate cyclohydrolase
MKLLLGKPIADDILNRLKSDISLRGEKPGLAVILIGNDQASHLYVSLKEKTACAIGMNFFRFDLAEKVPENEVLNLIQKLNVDDKIHGIIVQLPLPNDLNVEKVISSINPEKDVDGFSAENVSNFLQGIKKIEPVFPHAIMLLIESSGEILKGKNAVVIANSDEFGKIMTVALEQKNISAEYFLAKKISASIDTIREADIVVSAVGSPGLLNGQMLKEGVIIIDGGIEKVDGKVIGDVDFPSIKEKNGFISPVPGGVGPVTIACLLENVCIAFKAQQKEK